jgi:chemotaxis protein methyltransferase CheR
MTIAPADFDYISEHLRRQAAIVLEPGKEYLAETRLEPVVRKRGLASLSELVRQLRVGAPGLSHDVVDAMTTNETSFFRDVHPFESLRTTILPEMIEKRRATRSLTIWCAASSSGQEMYTIAMVIRQHFPELSSWRVRIHGTDISPTMLERARAGRFSQLEVNRGLPAPMLVKHFTHVGREWQVSDDLRSMCTFAPLNLAAPFTAVPPADLVFIRNVLIYFDVATKKDILGRICRVLRPDGYLLLGGAETTINIDDNWQRHAVGKTSWYRPTP